MIHTDNGSEFSNLKEIEYREIYSRIRANVFYCNPSSLYQKGSCEVNYELICRILPKGRSFYYGEDLLKKIRCSPIEAETSQKVTV